MQNDPISWISCWSATYNLYILKQVRIWAASHCKIHLKISVGMWVGYYVFSLYMTVFFFVCYQLEILMCQGVVGRDKKKAPTIFSFRMTKVIRWILMLMAELNYDVQNSVHVYRIVRVSFVDECCPLVIFYEHNCKLCSIELLHLIKWLCSGVVQILV